MAKADRRSSVGCEQLVTIHGVIPDNLRDRMKMELCKNYTPLTMCVSHALITCMSHHVQFGTLDISIYRHIHRGAIGIFKGGFHFHCTSSVV